MQIAALFLLMMLATAGCNHDVPAVSIDLAAPGVSIADLATSADAMPADLAAFDFSTGCVELTGCQCITVATCQPISEDCWCPFPDCAPGSCVCTGGRYFGCAPAASRCARTVNCRPPEVAAGPDDAGCFYCR